MIWLSMWQSQNNSTQRVLRDTNTHRHLRVAGWQPIRTWNGWLCASLLELYQGNQKTDDSSRQSTQQHSRLCPFSPKHNMLLIFKWYWKVTSLFLLGIEIWPWESTFLLFYELKIGYNDLCWNTSLNSLSNILHRKIYILCT